MSLSVGPQGVGPQGGAEPGRSDRGAPGFQLDASAASLCTLVYRSRAVRPFSTTALLALTQAAQRRNQFEAITGLVLYDDTWFYQWLEGPEDSLARVMLSINNDARHTDIEVLARKRTFQRTFAGWDMKLALPDTSRASSARGVIHPSRITVDTMKRCPEIAPSVFERLALPQAKAGAGAASILEEVIRASVIPQLAHQHGLACEDTPRLDLADLLAAACGGDTDAVMATLRERTRPDPSAHLAAALVGLAARELGDRWLADGCSALDLTAGLTTLDSAVRRMSAVTFPSARAGSVLVAAHGGEAHGLGAALDAERFRDAGWLVHQCCGEADRVLAKRLARDRFDALALSLSPALHREDRLPALARTVAAARAASCNPALRVLVSGRIFTERLARASAVGADMTVDAAKACRPPRRA